MPSNFFLLLLFAGVTNLSIAQITQSGLVREINSNKKTLAGVQIIFEDAIPTVSDNNGEFQIVFYGKKRGGLIFLNQIRKEGYELVNGKELNNLQISNNEKFSVDIILAKEGVIDAAKKEYYEVSDKALLDGFKGKKRELREQIKKEEISSKEYINKLNQLQKQYDNQRLSLNTLAEKFARVNFDDVSDEYREALELFKSGLIDEALKKLEDADYLGRSGEHLKERERIKNAIKQIAREREENEKGIQEDIIAILKQAEIYRIKDQMEDAGLVYELLLQLDSNSIIILKESASYYFETQQKENAILVYKQIVEHPNATGKDKIAAKKIIKLFSQ